MELNRSRAESGVRAYVEYLVRERHDSVNKKRDLTTKYMAKLSKAELCVPYVSDSESEVQITEISMKCEYQLTLLM
ncbi:hypothetical protein DPMN_133948 [Dreissena polymorpha]|uniref:Uncharacterized protein n=1 Tax=Dreissena polymorpha TaxID=45954 RepID=A0A9D4FVB7_DREPO|nr:hypothetical protein DPMN_133948 [Dreissena polymorpha]